jgi:hypothetical protein
MAQLNETKRMQQLAGLITESQLNEVLQNDDLIYDRMSIIDQEQLVSMILSFAENNPSVTLVDYLNNEFGYNDDVEEAGLNEADDYDYNDYDLDIEFKNAPDEAPYEKVLDIMKSYEDESVLNDFKAEFPEGKPVKKKDYSNFGGVTLIDDMSEISFIQANWINMFDKDVYKKAGLI